MTRLRDELNSKYNIYKNRHISSLYLNSPLTGIALTETEIKLPLSVGNFDIKTSGGFSFADTNNRVYWDAVGVIGRSLPAMFVGSAGLEVTAGISGSAHVFLILKIDGDAVLDTPMTFDALNAIGPYSGNSILADDLGANLLQSGSYYEIWAKAGVGESLTLTLDYLNVIIKRD